MALTVKPHPAHPNGGFALLEAPASEVPGDEVVIAVFDTYSERHLGEGNWQATPEAFGPYPLEQAGDKIRVRIGPEIVNHIEEYAALRISLNGKEWQVDWPDNVIQLPGAARLGPIFNRGEKAVPNDAVNLVGSKPDLAPSPSSQEVTEDTAVEPLPESDEATVKKGNSAIWLGVMAVILAAVAAAAWYYLSMPATEPEPAPEPATETAAPDPAPNGDNACAAEAIAALDTQPFDRMQEQLATCGSAITPDIALGLIEKAADRNDPAALVAMAEFYDGQENTNPIESVIGVTFADTPSVAAAYYARGRDAGDLTSTEKLARLCARMAGRSETLIQTAFKDYCDQ